MHFSKNILNLFLIFINIKFSIYIYIYDYFLGRQKWSSSISLSHLILYALKLIFCLELKSLCMVLDKWREMLGVPSNIAGAPNNFYEWVILPFKKKL